MNSVESSMEQALQDAGFGISSTPPGEAAQPTQEAAPVEAAPQTETAPEPSAESAPVQEPVQQEVQEQAQEQVQESVQEPVQETAPQQEEQSSLNTDDSSVEEFFNALQNEMLSAQVQSKSNPKQILQQTLTHGFKSSLTLLLRPVVHQKIGSATRH